MSLAFFFPTNITRDALLTILKRYKRARVSIFCDINALGAVEQERSRRETQGAETNRSWQT